MIPHVFLGSGLSLTKVILAVTITFCPFANCSEKAAGKANLEGIAHFASPLYILNSSGINTSTQLLSDRTPSVAEKVTVTPLSSREISSPVRFCTGREVSRGCDCVQSRVATKIVATVTKRKNCLFICHWVPRPSSMKCARKSCRSSRRL